MKESLKRALNKQGVEAGTAATPLPRVLSVARLPTH